MIAELRHDNLRALEDPQKHGHDASGNNSVPHLRPFSRQTRTALHWALPILACSLSAPALGLCFVRITTHSRLKNAESGGQSVLQPSNLLLISRLGPEERRTIC